MKNNMWFILACVLVFFVGYNINDVAVSFPRYKVAVVDVPTILSNSSEIQLLKVSQNKKMEEWIMKKKFKLEDLDCANCAAKMEDAIKKIPGVNDASVSFMTQKMSIDAEDAKFDEIMKEVVAVCAKVEPDCKILF